MKNTIDAYYETTIPELWGSRIQHHIHEDTLEKAILAYRKALKKRRKSERAIQGSFRYRIGGGEWLNG
jgi:hypothetical protein